MTSRLASGFLVLAVLAGASAGDADDRPTVGDVVTLCRTIDGLPSAQRMPALDVAVEVAEQAVVDDPRDAQAQFAAFCSIGKRRQLLGLGLGSLGDVRRARRALEHALELAPDWPDAIAAKGAFLLELPSLLGGDRDEAERLLQRAVVLDPDNAEARRLLDGLRAGVVSEP